MTEELNKRESRIQEEHEDRVSKLRCAKIEERKKTKNCFRLGLLNLTSRGGKTKQLFWKSPCHQRGYYAVVPLRKKRCASVKKSFFLYFF